MAAGGDVGGPAVPVGGAAAHGGLRAGHGAGRGAAPAPGHAFSLKYPKSPNLGGPGIPNHENPEVWGVLMLKIPKFGGLWSQKTPKS